MKCLKQNMMKYIKNFLEADSLRDFRGKKKYMVLLSDEGKMYEIK